MPDEIQTFTTTEDGSTGKKGMLTDIDILPDLIDWADQICACGPPAMYQTMAAQRLGKKIPTQVSLEVRMGCGLGACYGCSIKTRHGMKRVCQDGPVFDLEEILWQEVVV